MLLFFLLSFFLSFFLSSFFLSSSSIFRFKKIFFYTFLLLLNIILCNYYYYPYRYVVPYHQFNTSSSIINTNTTTHVRRSLYVLRLRSLIYFISFDEGETTTLKDKKFWIQIWRYQTSLPETANRAGTLHRQDATQTFLMGPILF